MCLSISELPNYIYLIIKCALYLFTSILALFGILTLLFSIWYMIQLDEYHIHNNGIALSIFVATLIIGILLIFQSLFGFLGVLKENLCFAKLFLAGMLVSMVAEIVTLCVIYSNKRDILENANNLFGSFIQNYVDDNDMRALIDAIQSELHCCGITSYADWDMNEYYRCGSGNTFACGVPGSCCKSSTTDLIKKNNLFCGLDVRKPDSSRIDNIYQGGCKFAISAWLERQHTNSIIAFIVTMAPQFFGLILIITFIMSLENLLLAKSVNMRTRKIATRLREKKYIPRARLSRYNMSEDYSIV